MHTVDIKLRDLATSNLQSCFREQESKIFNAEYTCLKLKDPTQCNSDVQSVGRVPSFGVSTWKDN